MMRRVRTWLRRRINSIRFGVPFQRSRNAKLPAHLRLHGTDIKIHAPNEAGVNADFVTIFLDDCYGLLDVALPQKARVIDIGANIGLFSMAARFRFPDATIHAYEPNPRLSAFIRSHASQAKFHFFSEAVALRDGHVALVDRADSNLATTVDSDSSTIPSVAFPRALERIGGHADLVKIDCEGAEWPLLFDSAVWPSIDNVTLEYHLWAATGLTHDDVVRRLEQLGFTITSHVPEETTGTIRAHRR
jgi:FkbM family methyltransferase